jgi:hypothetical protein
MTARCALSRSGSDAIAARPASTASPKRPSAVRRSQRASSACRRSWRKRSRSTPSHSSYQSGSRSPAPHRRSASASPSSSRAARQRCARRATSSTSSRTSAARCVGDVRTALRAVRCRRHSAERRLALARSSLESGHSEPAQDRPALQGEEGQQPLRAERQRQLAIVAPQPEAVEQVQQDWVAARQHALRSTFGRSRARGKGAHASAPQVDPKAAQKRRTLPMPGR